MLWKGAFVLALAFSAARAQDGPQLYRTHCLVCHGQEGESVPGVSFRSGKFRRASTDDDLSRIILGGIPGTGMPPTNLAADDRRSLVAYLHSLHDTYASTHGAGDAARGLAVVESKGACLRCHRVGENGSRLGPDLSDIGMRHDARYLEQSLLDPNASIAPANRFVHAVTRQGTAIDGRRLNEDTHTIQLIDRDERLVSLDKAGLRELTTLKTSPMPSYRDKLSRQEVADVVSYLLSLKGSQ